MKSNNSMEPNQPPLGSGKALSAVTLTTPPRISLVRFSVENSDPASLVSKDRR